MLLRHTAVPTDSPGSPGRLGLPVTFTTARRTGADRPAGRLQVFNPEAVPYDKVASPHRWLRGAAVLDHPFVSRKHMGKKHEKTMKHHVCVLFEPEK